MYGIILPIDFHIFKMVIAPPTRYALQMIYGDVPGPTWTLSYEKMVIFHDGNPLIFTSFTPKDGRRQVFQLQRELLQERTKATWVHDSTTESGGAWKIQETYVGSFTL